MYIIPYIKVKFLHLSRNLSIFANMSYISHITETTTLVDSVESAIYEYITEKHLCPGDSLPHEIELAEILGVGRNVIREALSRMRSIGILESRKRRGIVLKTLDITKNFDKLFCPRMLDKSTLVDLLELRLWLEESIIPVIFNRICDTDISDLESIVSDETYLVDGKVATNNEVAFHSRIFSITGNRTILNLQASLIPVYRYVHDNHEEFISLYEEGKDLRTSHKDMLDALKSRDSVRYHEVISNHLIAYRRYIDKFRNNLDK